mmetsp:Transcript_19945/g.49983  ORF Transcript_19945/g.49983 Transcript_19945/m.49983 type:complete len:254 (-) Transcript_19945:98-859(-)
MAVASSTKTSLETHFANVTSSSAHALRTAQTGSRSREKKNGSTLCSASVSSITSATSTTACTATSRTRNDSSCVSAFSSGTRFSFAPPGPSTAASVPPILAPDTRISSSSPVMRLAICVSSTSCPSDAGSSRLATVATAASAAVTTCSMSSSTSRNATHSRPVATSSSCCPRVFLMASASVPSCSARICRTSLSSSCASSSIKSSGKASLPSIMACMHTCPRLRTWNSRCTDTVHARQYCAHTSSSDRPSSAS